MYIQVLGGRNKVMFYFNSLYSQLESQKALQLPHYEALNDKDIPQPHTEDNWALW